MSLKKRRKALSVILPILILFLLIACFKFDVNAEVLKDWRSFSNKLKSKFDIDRVEIKPNEDGLLIKATKIKKSFNSKEEQSYKELRSILVPKLGLLNSGETDDHNYKFKEWSAKFPHNEILNSMILWSRKEIGLNLKLFRYFLDNDINRMYLEYEIEEESLIDKALSKTDFSFITIWSYEKLFGVVLGRAQCYIKKQKTGRNDNIYKTDVPLNKAESMLWALVLGERKGNIKFREEITHDVSIRNLKLEPQSKLKDDGKTIATTFEDSLTDGVIHHYIKLQNSHPLGKYTIRIFIENKLTATFFFTLIDDA